MNRHQNMNEVRRNINDVRQNPNVINVQNQQVEDQQMQGQQLQDQQFLGQQLHGQQQINAEPGGLDFSIVEMEENPLLLYLPDQLDVPCRAIHKDLNKALSNIFKWTGLKEGSSQPVYNAATDLLNAKTDRTAITAIEDLITSSMNYIKANGGAISSSGKQRITEVKDLLKEVCVFAAGSSEAVLSRTFSLINNPNTKNKYSRTLSTDFDSALIGVYGKNTNFRGILRSAKDRDAQTLQTIRQWGSVTQRAEEILNTRVPVIRYTYEDQESFKRDLDSIDIPDVKNLSDFEILEHTRLSNMRNMDYYPLKQNLEYLISKGVITDNGTIEKYRAKIDLLGEELNIYEARLRIIAGHGNQADTELVKQCAYKDDNEKKALQDARLKSDLTMECEEYKKFAKITAPDKKITRQILSERAEKIKRERAKKECLLTANKIKKDDLIKEAEDDNPEEIISHYKKEADKILAMDISALFNFDISESGILKDAVTKLEIIGKLSGIDNLLNEVRINEEKLDPEKRMEMRGKGIALLDSEKGALESLAIIAKNCRALYEKTAEIQGMTDYDQFTLSDYEQMPQRAKDRLFAATNLTPKEMSVKRLCEKYSELLDIRHVISESLPGNIETFNFNKGLFDEDRENARTTYEEDQRKKRIDRIVESTIKNAGEKDRKAESERQNFKEDGLLDIGSKAEELLKKREKRIIESDVEPLLGAYADLDKEGKTEEDIKKVRSHSVKIISELTRIEKSEFDHVETSEIVGLLQSIKDSKMFDIESFKSNVQKKVDDVKKEIDLDQEKDNQKLIAEIEEIRSRNNGKLTKLDECSLRDKCLKALDGAVERDVRTRDSLDYTGTYDLVKYTVSLLKVADITVDPEAEGYKKPTKEQEETYRKTVQDFLSGLSGVKKEEFSEIPLEKLDEIFLTPFFSLGDNTFNPRAYIKRQVETQKRLRLIDGALSTYRNFDAKNGEVSELDSSRQKMVEALCKLTDRSAQDFEYITLKDLAFLLQSAGKNAEYSKTLRKNFEESFKNLTSDKSLDKFEKEFDDILFDEKLSEDYKQYLKKELAVSGAVKFASALAKGKAGEFKISRKELDNFSADELFNIVSRGRNVESFDIQNSDTAGIEAYRKKCVALLREATEFNTEFFEKLPTSDLADMSRKLVYSFNDRKAYDKTILEMGENELLKYESGDFLTVCDNLLAGLKESKTRETDKNYVKEMCIYFLTDIARVKDLNKEELLKHDVISLYETAHKQFEADRDKLKARKVQRAEKRAEIEAQRKAEQKEREKKEKELLEDFRKMAREKARQEALERALIKYGKNDELNAMKKALEESERVLAEKKLLQTKMLAEREEILKKDFAQDDNVKEINRIISDTNMQIRTVAESIKNMTIVYKEDRDNLETQLNRLKKSSEAHKSKTKDDQKNKKSDKNEKHKSINYDDQKNKISDKCKMLKSNYMAQSGYLREHARMLDEKLEVMQDVLKKSIIALSAKKDNELTVINDKLLALEKELNEAKKVREAAYEAREKAVQEADEANKETRKEFQKIDIETAKLELPEEQKPKAPLLAPIESVVINSIEESIRAEIIDASNKSKETSDARVMLQMLMNADKLKDQQNTVSYSSSMYKDLYQKAKLFDKNVGFKPFKVTAFEDFRKELEDTEWENDERKTLDLMGSLMSSEKLYEENGKEIVGPERIRAMLLKKSDILTKILNETLSEKRGGPLDTISIKIYGVENALLDKIKKNVFESLSSMINKYYTDKMKDLKKPEIVELKKTDVIDFLQQYITEKQLFDIANGLDKVMKESEGVLDQMVSQAAEDLFGVSQEEIEPLFSEFDSESGIKQKNEEIVKGKNKENEKEIEKEKKRQKEELEKEQLKALRDSVFDTKNGQGRYLYLVIKNYYKNAPVELKREMLANILKDIRPTKVSSARADKGAEIFASMLKGAGPIMQKLFQGIPEHMLSKPFKHASSVVKSSLAPISPEYVDKKLAMIKDAANKKNKLGIKNIKKIGSLGAASIAETFLCEVTYENKAPEQVVIKLMRPTINRTTLENERAYIQDCAIKADNTGVMSATFNAHYKKICEELDLSNERENALKGEKAYTYKDNNANVTVQSASVKTEFPAGVDYLVMKKAEGVSADKYMADLYKYGQDKLSAFKNPIQGSEYSVSLGREKELLKVRNEIVQKISEAEESYKHLEQLTQTWILKALFEKVGDSCFLHGDLHAGNIMIAKNHLTVLDFGNCSVFDNSEKISRILKMMASAFVGESGRFVDAMEDLVNMEKKANPYNSLSSSDKKALKTKLKAELDKILKLGNGRSTGERIFASILKAQQLGIKMPQEVLNFTECQQRLENSLREFENAIYDLRKTLSIIDTMPVVGADAKKIINPVTYVYYRNGSKNSTEDVYSTNLHFYYSNFKMDSQNDIIKVLKDKKEYDNHRNFGLNIKRCIEFKDYYDWCEKYFDKKVKVKKGDPVKKAVNFEKIFKGISGWKENYMEFAQISSKRNTGIALTEEERARFGKLSHIAVEIQQAAGELIQSKEFLSLVGMKAEKVLSMMAKASQGDVTSFDRMVDLLEDINLALETADSYNTVRKYKKQDDRKENLMKGFANKYLQYQKKQLLRSTYSEWIRHFASADLVQENYKYYHSNDVILGRIKNDLELENEGRRIFKQVNGKYEYGELATKVLDLYSEYEKVGSSSELTPEKIAAEQNRITKELIYHFNYLELKATLKLSDDLFENEIGEYMKEDTELSKNLREKFKQLQTIREKFIDQKHKNEFSKEYEVIKNERLKAEDEFTWAFLQMGQEKLKPMMNSISNYRYRPLNDFVDVMTDVLYDKQVTIGFLFGVKESIHFKNAIADMMKDM